MKIKIFELMTYLGSKIHHIFDGAIGELNQNRTILIWVYSAALLALIFFCAVNNPGSQNTAIMTLGGIVGTCFSSWVVAGTYERVNRLRHREHQPMKMTEKDQEQAAGD